MIRYNRKTALTHLVCMQVIMALILALVLPCYPARAETEGLPDKLSLVCSSGAGAWDIGVTLNMKGKFKGSYHDSDMGDGGAGYDATVHYSRFSGSFKIKKKDGFRYTVKVTDVSLKQKPGKEKIKQGALYKSEDVKLEKGKYTLYCPGLPMDQLPEEAREWLTFACFIGKTDSLLDGYVLYKKGDDPYYGERP